MIDLDEELRRLADSLDLPATPADDDLARGRAARRTRNLATVGASVVGVSMVIAGVALLSGGTSDRAVEPNLAVGGTTSPSPSTSAKPTRHRSDKHHAPATSAPADPFAPMSKHEEGVLRDALDGYHDVLAEHLDPNGTQLAAFSNYQGGGNELGSKFDWSGGGMLQISVAAKLPHFWCCRAAGDYPMHDVPMAGVRSARVGSDATSTAVIVEHEDGTGVFLVASSEFGNNGTSIAATGLTAHQLLEAAADPRLVLPDPLPSGEPGPGLFR